MRLAKLDLRSPHVLGDFAVSFLDSNTGPRPITVIFGGPGAGKTSLVNALSCTRPGHAMAMSLRPSEPRIYASATWQLGIDEPDRQKPLEIVSPNAPDELFPRSSEQRREQAFFDRLAREGGFVFLAFSALRWFSKGPVILGPPESTVARYDVREYLPLEDAARHDLSRECKQALIYAAIARSLPRTQVDDERSERLGAAVHEVVSNLVELAGYRYLGVSQRSLAPMFRKAGGPPLSFDALPTHVKHMTAFGLLPLRAAWAAYPDLEPRRAPSVVAIDQLELQQDESVAIHLLNTLSRLLPEVQWIITTRSPALLSSRDPSEVLALRRTTKSGEVTVYTGADAQLH